MSGTNGLTKLDPTEYWHLRASVAELERDQTALAALQARVEATRVRHETLWQTTLNKYGLDPSRRYLARDEDCGLAESEA
jgi:hypothetical protein